MNPASAPDHSVRRPDMNRISFTVLAVVLLTTSSTPQAAQAASKYKARSLLTAAELEAVVRVKATTPDDSDSSP
jgi:hypothetical protein